MRITLFHTTLPEGGRKPGGVETAVHRLANALVQSGDEVTVYSLSPCPEEALYRHRMLFAGSPFLRTNSFGRLMVLPALLNFTSFDEAEVVHFHGDDWFYLRRSKPTLRTLHGSALREAQSAQSWPRRLSQYAVYPLEQLSARLCRIPLAVGRDAARIYRTGNIVDNGVDPRVFYPGTKTTYPSVLFVGTWNGRKRGQFLFDLFIRQVLPRVPEARLQMVSDYCPEHPAVIAERFPSDERLAQSFRESWVFAYPSAYEGFGIAYLEALASGTPVLTSFNEGAQYVLDGGKYGVIANDDAFPKKLIELLTSPVVRKSLETAGLERTRRFSWENIAAQHREFYAKAKIRVV